MPNAADIPWRRDPGTHGVPFLSHRGRRRPVRRRSARPAALGSPLTGQQRCRPGVGGSTHAFAGQPLLRLAIFWLCLCAKPRSLTSGDHAGTGAAAGGPRRFAGELRPAGAWAEARRAGLYSNHGWRGRAGMGTFEWPLQISRTEAAPSREVLATVDTGAVNTALPTAARARWPSRSPSGDYC